MSILELAYVRGQFAAMLRPKLGWLSTTHPVVQESGLLKSQPSAKPPALPSPPSSPAVISETFDRHEQGETRVEPRRKLSADLCTTCRKPKHYGSCKHPIPIKRADFNLGMTGDGASDSPSTSTHYHSATTADSSMARARDGRPADEQAASAFADFFRNLGIANQADQTTQTYEGLSKVSALTPGQLIGGGALLGAGVGALRARPGHRLNGALGGALFGGASGAAAPALAPMIDGAFGGNPSPSFHVPDEHIPKFANFLLPGSAGHSMSERRGPTTNPYDERLTIKSPPVGQGYVGDQAIAHAFGQIDGVTDTTNIEGSSAPTPGPLA